MSGLARALAAVASTVAFLSAVPAQAQETRAALDPALVEGRGAAVDFAEQEAENAVHTGELLSASATGDIASYDPDRRGDEQRAAYTLSAEASGRDARAARPRRARRVHPHPRRQRDHRALQHPGRSPGRRDPVAARGDRRRQARAGDDLDVGVRVAVRRLSVLERPEQRLAASGLVASADGEPGEAAPAEPLLRRAAAAAAQDLPRRRQAAAVGSRGRARGLDGHRPARLRARAEAEEQAAARDPRDAVRRRPERAARLVARLRRRDRLRQAARQVGPPARRRRLDPAGARSRSRGTSSSTTSPSSAPATGTRSSPDPPRRAPTPRPIRSARRASPRAPTPSGSTASGPSRAAATTSAWRTSRSSARSTSGSTPTRSTASAAP